MLVNVAVQLVLSTLCFWQLSRNPVEDADVHRAVVFLVAVHSSCSLFCVACYRIPERHISKTAHYVGCVPSVGQLHRRRFSFFSAAATLSLLLFVCTRHTRRVAGVWCGLYVATACLALIHCHRWHTFMVYLLGVCTVAVIMLLEVISGQNVIATVLVYKQ